MMLNDTEWELVNDKSSQWELVNSFRFTEPASIYIQSPHPHGVSVVDAMKCPELSKTNVANAKNVLPAKGFKKFV